MRLGKKRGRAMRKIIIDTIRENRFHTKYTIRDDGCWEWTGFINKDGYGTFNQAGRKSILAHRWSYVLHNSEIPEGMAIDHLCRNRNCVNPEHLEPVSWKENLARGFNAKRLKTHCPQGHEYNEENTYTINSERGQHRMCRVCRYERNKLVSQRKRVQNV